MERAAAITKKQKPRDTCAVAGKSVLYTTEAIRVQEASTVLTPENRMPVCVCVFVYMSAVESLIADSPKYGPLAYLDNTCRSNSPLDCNHYCELMRYQHLPHP